MSLRLAQWIVGSFVWVGMAGCSVGPCGRGQELRELTDASRDIRQRGCVEKNEDGDYRRQGKWEAFALAGHKRMEVTYKDGKKEGVQTEWSASGDVVLEATFVDGKRTSVAFYTASGIKMDRAPMVASPRPDGSMQLRAVEPID